MLGATPVDVILLNLGMTGVDGFSLCTTLRQTSEVPILLLLKQGSIDEIVHGFAAGADDYLCQPFEPLDLLYRIQAVMRRVAWQALAGRPPMPVRRPLDRAALNPWGMMM
jgi:DNA-binding response OmpR family regulator